MRPSLNALAAIALASASDRTMGREVCSRARLCRVRCKRLDGARKIVQVRPDKPHRHPLRRLGCGRSRERDHRLAPNRNQRLWRNLRNHGAPAIGEGKLTVHRKAVESISDHQWLKTLPPGFQRLDHVTRDTAVEAPKIEIVQPGANADLRHDFGQRSHAGAPIQPVAGFVVRTVDPRFHPVRKIRPRSRIPRPDVRPAHVDHPAAIDIGNRIVRGLVPVREHRLKVSVLDEVIPGTVRIVREETLRRLRVMEDVGLVRPLVDRRAAELGEPDRLRPGLPRGRPGRLHASQAVHVRV